MLKTNNKNNKNNKYGGQYHYDDCGQHLNTIQRYPKFTVNDYYDYGYDYYNQDILIPQIIEPTQEEYPKINIAKAFEIYNWFIEQYNDIIKIYNDFYDEYNKITQLAKIRNINIFEETEPIKKFGDLNSFQKIDYPYDEVIPHAEMVKLLNKMNDRIRDIKNLSFEIYEIMTKKLIIEDPLETIKTIVENIKEQRQEWKRVTNINNMSGGSKLLESSTQVDTIIEKIKILDDLFKDPHKINNLLDILKNQKIKKTVEKIKENHEYHKKIDDEKNLEEKEEKEKKYKYNDYKISEFPKIEVSDLKIDYRYFENEKDNTDISKLNKILDQKISLINAANSYLDVEKNFLNQKIQNFQKKNYENNDFTFLDRSNLTGGKQILLEYIDKKRELKQYENDMELYDELMGLYKDGEKMIMKYNENLEEKNNILEQEIAQNNKKIEKIKNDNDQEIDKIKKEIISSILDNLKVPSQLFKNMTLGGNILTSGKSFFNDPKNFSVKIDSATNEIDIIAKNKFTIKDNNKKKLIDSNSIIEIKKFINNQEGDGTGQKNPINLIKDGKGGFTEKMAKIKEKNEENNKEIKPINHKNVEKQEQINTNNINLLNYIQGKTTLNELHEQITRIYNLPKTANFIEYRNWYTDKYKSIYDKYQKSNLSQKTDAKTFIAELRLQLESLRESIKNKPELKFSALNQQEKKIIADIKTVIFTDNRDLNEKLFNTIGEMKKISESINLVFDFVSKDELQKFDENEKIIINLQNTEFYKMKGGNLDLYNKNMKLVEYMYIFFKRIDEYINKYIDVLKLNREAIYRKFYEYIVCNELLQSQPKFDPILYLSYDDIEEYKQKIVKYKNPYLSSISEEMTKLCEKIKENFQDKDNSFLYIDPTREATFMNLLLLSHLVSIL
jgi:hypothetical protein